MKTIYTLLASSLLCLSIAAQNPMIFQPGPGLNNSTDQGGLTSGKDAWVNEGDGAYNGGADPYGIATPISNCNSTNTSAFFQFDLSSLPLSPDSVFFGVTHFDHTSYCYSNCNADFYFAPLTAAWDEQTINYSNFPAWGASFYGPINISFPNSFGNKEYNITSMYNQWKNGSVPNYGFAVFSQTVGCNNAAVYFFVHSSDDTDMVTRPYLKIYDATLGLNEKYTDSGIEIFPNPVIDFVNINSANEKIINVQLFDVLGKKMSDENVGSNHYQLNVQGLEPGIYFAQIKTENRIETRKIKILQ